MKTVVIIGACCYNKGSEALARGTVNIVKRAYPNSEIVLCSGEAEFGPQLSIDNVDKYVRRFAYYGGYSFKRIKSAFWKLIKQPEKSDKLRYSVLLNECKEADLVVVICGDNYDKSYHMFDFMHSLNVAIRKTCKKTMIMYDCSLEEAHIDDDVLRDFSLFDGITARENITLEALRNAIPSTKIYYAPDPAFIMEPSPTKLPDGVIPQKSIGINVSTMVADEQYGSTSEIVLSSYKNMIQAFLINTDSEIILIPHVMRNLDLKVLRPLYDEFKDNDRVHLIEDETLNATQLKYIISQFEFYVGARTHSTIAAYSSCVPTLVLGYSVKSIGIARDIFGTELGYVVPVNRLTDNHILAEAAMKLYEKRDEIREHLRKIMPGYIENAWSASEYFMEKVEGRQ